MAGIWWIDELIQTNQPSKKSYGDSNPPFSNFVCREIIKRKLAFNNQLRKTPFSPNNLSKFHSKTLYSHAKFTPFSQKLNNSLPKSKQSVTIPEAADRTPNDIHKVSYFIDNNLSHDIPKYRQRHGLSYVCHKHTFSSVALHMFYWHQRPQLNIPASHLPLLSFY